MNSTQVFGIVLSVANAAVDVLRRTEGENAAHCVNVSPRYRKITVDCKNSILCTQIFRLHPLLADTGFGLTIRVEGKTPINLPPLTTKPKEGADSMLLTLDSIAETSLSQWVKTDKNFLLLEDYVQSRGTTGLYSTDPDYKCLEVQPFLGLNAVMSLPRTELIGKPADNGSFIGARKKEAIEMAIASGQREQLIYEYLWGEAPGFERNWKMMITAIPMDREVLLVTENLDYGQRDHWIRIAEQSRNKQDA